MPGSFDPITDLYQVHANDAHAWVQVWFPGYGWQDFDPTAAVPADPPAPAPPRCATWAQPLAASPRCRSAVIVVAAGLVVVLVRWRRARPATWAERLARSAERAGRRAGRPRRPSETLAEYAGRLDHLGASGDATWSRLASVVEASAYGGLDPPPETQRALALEAKRARVGLAHASRARPTHPGDRSRNCEG